jgi:beta-N-acetylhexosaminidase
MPPSWPVLTAGIAQLGEGLVAEAGSDPVGFAAVDMAGSIPLILVDPAWQRRGIGTSLLAAALDRLRAAGVTSVTAASGGGSYIWPGVPEDLPAAVRFFASRGWRHSHDTLDLVADLTRYRPPSGTRERAANMGITVTPAAGADLADVLAFEAAAFPSWLRWFSAAGRDVLIARDNPGNIAGTLLLDGPGADTVFAPMIGPAAGTIGCVGVAPPVQGRGIGTALVVCASEILRDAGVRNCHIGWTVRESFYRRAGYRPWRRYAMFSSPA